MTQIRLWHFVTIVVFIFRPGLAQNLEGTWKMVMHADMSTNTETTIEEPEKYHITFTDSGTIFANVDCNVCTGKYTVGINQISFDSVICTEAACGSDSQGSLLMAVLYSGEVYQSGRDSLAIADGNLTVVALFLLDESLGVFHVQKSRRSEILPVFRKGGIFQLNFPSELIGKQIIIFNMKGKIINRLVYNGNDVKIELNPLNLFAISGRNSKTMLYRFVWNPSF